MQFRHKFSYIIAWCTPSRVGTPIWEILDPPLNKLAIFFQVLQCTLKSTSPISRYVWDTGQTRCIRIYQQECIAVGCVPLSSPYGGSPWQWPRSWTETPDRDPPPHGQRPPGQRPLDRDPWTETETPGQRPPGQRQRPPGQRPLRQRPPGPRPRPPHLWTNKHLWKHYLPATSFAGGKNRAFLL